MKEVALLLCLPPDKIQVTPFAIVHSVDPGEVAFQPSFYHSLPESSSQHSLEHKGMLSLYSLLGLWRTRDSLQTAEQLPHARSSEDQ